jgi:hypothetical protein
VSESAGQNDTDLLGFLQPKLFVRLLQQVLPANVNITDTKSVSRGWTTVFVCVQSIRAMQELRDILFTGDLSRSVWDKVLEWTAGSKHHSPLPNSYTIKAAGATALRASEKGAMIVADLSHFAKVYEHSLLVMDKLTPHQQEKLAECLEPGVSVPI